MAIVSSTTLNYVRLTLLFTIAYYLIFDARKILEYSGVIIMSSAMHLPMIVYNEANPNPLYGSLGLLVSVIGVTDLIVLLDSSFNYLYFELVVPMRLFFYFAAAIWVYASENIQIGNSVVCGFVFLEIWFHALLFSVVKDEKRERLVKENKIMLELKEKFDRNELEAEEMEKITMQLEKEEFQKIMSEFR